VQRAFYDRGLKSDVMFLNPRFPRDSVIQRQVLEGVHGVIELDVRSQNLGKIPLQVFDRSAGLNNVRFDQYQDLDPKVAAELVFRTKSQAATSSQPPYPSHNYGQPYPPSAAPVGYPGYPSAHANVPGGLGQGPSPTPDLANVVGQLDNSTLQQLLASLQAGQAASVQTSMPASMPTSLQPSAASTGGAAAPNSQIDINALLSNLKHIAGVANPTTPTATGMTNYASSTPSYQATSASNPLSPTAAPGGVTGVNGGTDTAAQVQNIMATLARYRQ
jgi:hypothetical protein